MLFLCNRPDQQQYFIGEPAQPLVNGTDPAPSVGGYYVDALQANARSDGYTVCMDLPFQNISLPADSGSQRRLCTVSVLDDRNWGGCVDLVLMQSNWTRDKTYAPTLSVVANTERAVDLVDSEGTYQITSCDGSSGGKCCLEGFIGVKKNGWMSARLRGISGQDACGDLFYWNYQNYQFNAAPYKYATDLYFASLYLSVGYDKFGRQYEVQNMSVVVRNGGSITIINDCLQAPQVLNHLATRYTTLQEGIDLGLIPEPLGYTPFVFDGWLVILLLCFSIFLVYFIGGCVLNRHYGDGYWAHPHVHALMVGLGLARRHRRIVQPKGPDGGAPLKTSSGFIVSLPPDWHSAVDQETGEVYYYNDKTKEVQWARPI